MVKQAPPTLEQGPHQNGHVPVNGDDHGANGTSHANGVVNGDEVTNQPSRGLRGLAEDAILHPHTPAYNATLKVVLVAILTSIVILALETIHPLNEDHHEIFHGVDMVLLTVFTAEYLLNIWVAPNRRAYVLSLWGIVDFLAIAPAYVEIAFGGVESLIFLRQLRILRVMRMLKLLKLAAEQAAESAAQATEKKSTFLMDIQIYMICLFTVLTISSSLLYQFEGVGPTVPELTSDALTELAKGEEAGTPPEWAKDHMVQLYAERAEKGWSNPVYTFTSVPKAYWWSIVTLTTTGYGDMFPVTLAGRIVAGGTMLAGLALFSLLTSVVGRALMTSLFGKGDDEEGVGHKIVVIGGGRLPQGVDVVALVAAAGSGPADLGVTSVPDASPPRERSSLETAFFDSEVKFSDIAASASHVAESMVLAASAGALDHNEAIRRENPGVLDKFIYEAFADHSSKLFMPMQQFLTSLIFASVVLVVALDSRGPRGISHLVRVD